MKKKQERKKKGPSFVGQPIGNYYLISYRIGRRRRGIRRRENKRKGGRVQFGFLEKKQTLLPFKSLLTFT